MSKSNMGWMHIGRSALYTFCVWTGCIFKILPFYKPWVTFLSCVQTPIHSLFVVLRWIGSYKYRLLQLTDASWSNNSHICSLMRKWERELIMKHCVFFLFFYHCGTLPWQNITARKTACNVYVYVCICYHTSVGCWNKIKEVPQNP